MIRRPLSRAVLGALIVLIGVAELLGQLGIVSLSLGDLLSTW